MDMLAYFLGRLAKGGAGGLVIDKYDEIIYTADKDAEGNDIIHLIDDNNIYEMKCSYENGKMKTIIYQGKTIELQYDGDRLSQIGDTEINLSNAPIVGGSGTGGTVVSIDPEKVVIDKDGVLDFTGGAVV